MTQTLVERIPAFSSRTYLRMAYVNAGYFDLPQDARALLDLLAVRADDAGRLRFARARIADLYPAKWDHPKYWARRDLAALDALAAKGWVRVIRKQGRRNTYALLLPRKRRVKRLRLEEGE